MSGSCCVCVCVCVWPFYVHNSLQHTMLQEAIWCCNSGTPAMGNIGCGSSNERGRNRVLVPER